MRGPGCSLLVSVLAASSVAAQQAPAATAPFSEQLSYLLGQASASFAALRTDSAGPSLWHTRYRATTGLDSTTAFTASSITELPRQHADGRPGTEVIGVFPLALLVPGDTVTFPRYRSLVGAALSTWQLSSPGGGHWTECADSKRGREVALSSGQTVGGELILTLSITVHPDRDCS